MSIVADALYWRGTDALLTLFVVTTDENAPQLHMCHGAAVPASLRQYLLEDEDRVLGGRNVFEFDVTFPNLPGDLHGYVRVCLGEALQSGAEVAWFAFEGTFSFEHLLSDSFVTHTYGVGDRWWHAAAIEDDDLNGPAWRERVRMTRRALLGNESRE